jgi:hypothetical protein
LLKVVNSHIFCEKAKPIHNNDKILDEFLSEVRELSLVLNS